MNVRLFSVLTTQLFQLYEKSEYICKLVGTYITVSNPKKAKKKRLGNPVLTRVMKSLCTFSSFFGVNKCGLAL